VLPGKSEQEGVFSLLADRLSKENIPVVLVGGFALHFYLVDRQTTDVDLLISENDFSRLSAALAGTGYRLTFRNEVLARFEGDQFPLLDLDFLFVDPVTLKRIMESGRTVDIGENKFLVPSLEHLIALKLHAIKQNPAARENIDLPDIVRLIQANHIDTRSESFRLLCLTFASEEIYNRINEAPDA
jgi:predicted nucleotidyltransferase